MKESFVEKPNLPDGTVKSVIIGEGYAAELGAALLPYGVRVIACPANPLVDPRLSSHADLSVIHPGGNRLAFTGALENCRDKARIEEFLLRCGITPVYLTDKPVFDIGSAIPITYSTSGSRCP